MTDLKDALISDSWPSPTADVQAFAYALQQAMAKVVQYADKTQCVSGIDSLEEDILDMLAVENRVVNYQQDYPVEKKRNVVKSVLAVYSLSGTSGAIKQMVQDVYNDSDIEEWYSYGGLPGHFRINVYDAYSDEKAAQIREIIAQLGKCSSIVDAVNFNGGVSEADMLVLAGPIDYTITYVSTVY